MEFLLTPNEIKILAERLTGKTTIKQGGSFAFNGDERIDFEEDDGTLHFFFQRDYAYAAADSLTDYSNRVSVKRIFYTQNGKHYLLIGVPWSWIKQSPTGDLIIDPTTPVTNSDDVRVMDAGQYGSGGSLTIGKAPGVFKSRTLVKFHLGASIPSNAMVLNAQMQLYYYATTGTTWLDRWVQAHQLLNDWDELQADSLKRLTGVNWLAPRGKIGPGSNPASEDANGQFESTMLFQQNQTSTWKVWNLTALTQKWLNGTAANYGVILWATNEDVNAYDLRFYSRENVTNKPQLVVTWSNTPKTVYFLKDHLGSTRATVDQTGAVVGYDDYDPWGYALGGRTMATQWTSLQAVAKNKFTGKERDDEFGINWDYFGARYYDAQIGRWMARDPNAEKYAMWGPYCYALNNPVRLFDLDGKDVFVAFSGGISGSRQLKPNETTTGQLVTEIADFANKAGIEFNGVGYLSSFSGAEESREAIQFIKDNLSEGEKLIIYGYSSGGDHAVELAEQLSKAGIKVDVLITVDAADALLSGSTVNNTIPENVGVNYNYYQTDRSGGTSGTGSDSGSSNTPGSRGFPNKASKPSKTKVINIPVPNTTHGKIDEDVRKSVKRIYTEEDN